MKCLQVVLRLVAVAGISGCSSASLETNLQSTSSETITTDLYRKFQGASDCKFLAVDGIGAIIGAAEPIECFEIKYKCQKFTDGLERLRKLRSDINAGLALYADGAEIYREIGEALDSVLFRTGDTEYEPLFNSMGLRYRALRVAIVNNDIERIKSLTLELATLEPELESKCSGVGKPESEE